MSRYCPDPPLEQKENPRQEEINKAHDTSEAIDALNYYIKDHKGVLPQKSVPLLIEVLGELHNQKRELEDLF